MKVIINKKEFEELLKEHINSKVTGEIEIDQIVTHSVGCHPSATQYKNVREFSIEITIK